MADMDTINLGSEEVRTIREALIIGLHSYGEVDRIMSVASFMKEENKPLPDLAVPMHPTGSVNAIRAFSDALDILNRI